MDAEAAVDTREEQQEEQVIELGEVTEETQGGPWGGALEFFYGRYR